MSLARIVPALAGVPPFEAAPDPAVVSELLAGGSGPNIAATTAGADDPVLRPHLLPLEPAEAATRIGEVMARMPRWRLRDRNGPVLWAVHSTRLIGFRDDVLLLLTGQPGRTRIDARSASRLGRSDLGQNRRNLAELWRGLGAHPSD